MGKVKKAATTSKDEGQKKISSFFQKNVVPSMLFSEVGTKTFRNAKGVSIFPEVASAEENKSQTGVVTVISESTDADEFQLKKKIRSPNIEKIVASSKSSGGKVENSSKGPQFSNENVKHMTSGDVSSCSLISKDKSGELGCQVIPETQFLFTPENKQNKNEQNCESALPRDCVETDFGIIPDTPVSDGKPVKPKRPLGRSFLLSATSIASNPIIKAKENRRVKMAQKKRASLARKGLVSASMTLNEKSTCGENSAEKESYLAVGKNSVEIDFDSKSLGNIDNSDTRIRQPNIQTGSTEDETPTKIYPLSETASVKRMSKAGLSPGGKRINNKETGFEILVDNDSVKALSFEDERYQQNILVQKMAISNSGMGSSSISEDKCILTDKAVEQTEPFGDVIEFEKLRQEKTKQKKEILDRRRMELLEERKMKDRQLKKKNHEKLVNYQLSGNVKLHVAACDRSSDTCGETVKNDDTLEDLLQELKSPSLLKSESKLQFKKSLGKHLCKARTKDTVNKHQKAIELSCDTNENDSNPLVNTKAIFKHRSFDSNLSSGLREVEWTEEDESYFKELGMSIESDIDSKAENTSLKNLNTDTFPSEAANSKTCYHQKKQSDLESCLISVAETSVKISPILKTKTRTSETLRRNEYSKTETKAGCDVDIKEFQTQEDRKSNSEETDIVMFTNPCDMKSERENDGMEIDDFPSQVSSELCEEFDNLTPFKSSKKRGDACDFHQEAPCSKFGRYVVTAVDHDSAKHDTTLTIATCQGDVSRKCILHGFWLDTHVKVGDIVNVLASFRDDECHITDRDGLLVVNPDTLLSGTTVVSSVFCMRKSILKEKFKGSDTGNIQMLYGSIIHSVFQQVLRKKLLTEEDILGEADRIVKQTANLLDMYGHNVTEDAVRNEIKSYIPQTIAWIKQHTNIGQDMFGNQRKTKPDILITKVNDIEENIWSPRFGIKGKIDLTVETCLKKEKTTKILPLELKTGKPSFSVEHKGQVTLYSMMCSDRREDPGRGLLLYLKEPSMKVIPADHVNQKGLVQLRNEMAYYISRQVVKTCDEEGQTTFHLGRLPDPITNLRACQKCPHLINCAIYQREVEGRESSNSGMSGLINESLQHLTASHMTYFTHWCLMLDLESQKDQEKRTVADIWCKSSTDREAVGDCISGVVLTDNGEVEDENQDTRILSFQRHTNNKRTTPLSEIGINKQDSVVVSCERPSWIAVCTGFVHHISTKDIQILIDRDGAYRLSRLKEKLLRIDKCNNFSTAGMFYTNVSRLMQDDSHWTAEKQLKMTSIHAYETIDFQKYQQLRRLIIDKVKPEFLNTLSKGNIEKVKAIFKTLNKPQKTSILKVLMSKDYMLIKGYPGTGKTSTIVALVNVLSTLGYSVLLTSYTHSAVDNILLKLKQDKVKFLRIGRTSKIHRDIHEFCIEKLASDIKSTIELEHFLHSQNIVATSCLGTNHPLFTRRQFDVCIVDEASQVIQAACLGPLFCSKKYVLVGDPKQLPPVVQSKEARNLGMDESLFMRLESTGATCELNLQYRMNSDIMYLSNQLVYNGCLKCGSDSVGNKVIYLPNKEKISQVLHRDPWLGDVVNNDLSTSVLFLDTHKVPAREEKCQAGTLHNPTESKIVIKIVEAFVQCGLDPDDIGIIAPYRSQVYLIRSKLDEGGRLWGSNVEVNTVDQYQGRDKSVIIISFVRSSEDHENLTGELLKDVRRLNVALTRAKVKLILIGNVSTLVNYPPIKELVKLLQNKNQIQQLAASDLS